MREHFTLPDDFGKHLQIANAKQRFDEARSVGAQIAAAGVPLLANPDHAAIFTDPPHLVAGPLSKLGYVNGWDARCYPSPVDGCDYINVSARLSEDSPARSRGWFDYVAVVHPVDEVARAQMLGEGYGNPFLHHVTFGIVPPQRAGADDVEYAGRLIACMVRTRSMIGKAMGDTPGTLIAAVPDEIRQDERFQHQLTAWIGDLPADAYQLESMEGGGYLLQFFALTGGRIEVAMRVGTAQTFNPKSVHKISKDEISTVQTQ